MHDLPVKPGDEAWRTETNRLAKKFEEAIGSGIPRPDPAREKTAAKFLDDAMGTPFHLVWFSVLGACEVLAACYRPRVSHVSAAGDTDVDRR